MCGIAGVLHADGEAASQEEVGAQLKQLLHRGPDSSGAFVQRNAGVGQTRLSVIDLTTGDPPMVTPDATIGAVLNGEIYNFAELRAELLGRGHVFTSTGDTEVLAHLAEDVGPVELAQRLHGMFAFAIWDARRERLVLGRDRFGKKPLHWWHDGTTFVFGSEIKALLAHPAVSAELDPSAIPAYLRLGYVPTPSTFFRGIRSVPPGHVLVLDGPRFEPRLTRYWDLPAPGELVSVGMDEAADLVRRALQRAVERRLVADVPVGAFLSGGIDSATVVGLMAAASTRAIRTFTIGFEDPAFDERAPARLIAERFGTEHTELVVKPDAVALVEQLVEQFDQPFGDSSAIPMWYLSELTRRDVTVALSGDGGDELFAGYERFTAGVAMAAFGHIPARGALLAVLRRAPSVKLRRFAAMGGTPMPDAYRNWVAYTSDDLATSLLRQDDDASLIEYRTAWAGTEGRATLDRLLDLNRSTYLLDDLLPKVDRTSMAHALEVRSPFLDHELAELAFRLPHALKARGTSRKRVLRAAVADLVPAEILRRPKKGFGVPLDRWFRTDLRTFVQDRLGPGARVRQHVRDEPLDRLLADHVAGRAPSGQTLWSLLMLEAFLRRQGW